MAYTTEVSWDRPLDESTEGLLIQEHLNAAIKAGTTDGSYTGTHPVIRTWTTAEAAQAWVDFLNTLTPPPSLAEVVTTS
jgi:hypothetical protein